MRGIRYQYCQWLQAIFKQLYSKDATLNASNFGTGVCMKYDQRMLWELYSSLFFIWKKQSKRHSRKPQWTSILCQLMYMNKTSNCNTDYIGSTRIINQYIHYLITCISLQLFRSLFWIAYFFLFDWFNYNNNRLAARFTIV